MRTLVVDIGGTKCAAGLADSGELLQRDSVQLPPGADATQVRTLVASLIAPLTNTADVCGFAFGGSFDFASQRCGRSFHVAGWEGFPVGEWLSDLAGCLAIGDNDANVAALGEYGQRDPATTNPMLYVTVSTGVGAAIVTEGHLLRGAHSLAGELGHLNIGHGQVCSCGQSGCLERAISGHWIQHDHRTLAKEHLRAEAVFHQWVDDLSRALWSVVTIVDPALIVVGGGMASQGVRLESALRSNIGRRAGAAGRVPPHIELGDSEGRTVLLGAAHLAQEAMS